MINKKTKKNYVFMIHEKIEIKSWQVVANTWFDIFFDFLIKNLFECTHGLRTPNEDINIIDIWKIGPLWLTKYVSAVPKNLGFEIRIEFSAVQWRLFPLWVSVVRGQYDPELWDKKLSGVSISANISKLNQQQKCLLR